LLVDYSAVNMYTWYDTESKWIGRTARQSSHALHMSVLTMQTQHEDWSHTNRATSCTTYIILSTRQHMDRQ